MKSSYYCVKCSLIWLIISLCMYSITARIALSQYQIFEEHFPLIADCNEKGCTEITIPAQVESKCKPGFGWNDLNGKCEECHCGGENISCTFASEDYSSGRSYLLKECVCPAGFLKNFGKCIDCNGTECTGITIPAQAESKCKPGFGWNTLTKMCQECHCGRENINCTFVLEDFPSGNSYLTKECVCPPGFLKRSSKCIDCACGGSMHSCKIITSVGIIPITEFKKCVCAKNYKEVEGKCQKMPTSLIQDSTSKRPTPSPTITFKPKTTETDGYSSSSIDGHTSAAVSSTTIKETNFCDSNPCLNGGSCIKNGNSFLCKCKKNYSGKICEKKDAIDSGVQIEVQRLQLINFDRIVVEKSSFKNESSIFTELLNIMSLLKKKLIG